MRPAAIIATPIALLAAFYLIAGHFWTALGIVAFMVTCASLAVAMWRGALLDDRDEECDRLGRENEALEAECQRLHLELTEAQLLSGQITEIPLVRPGNVIPLQRGPVPVADEPTPIHDRALIEAWIEDVQAWGEDVER